MVVFYTIWKKYDEIQLTKNKMDFNNRKMKKISPPSCKIEKQTKERTKKASTEE